MDNEDLTKVITITLILGLVYSLGIITGKIMFSDTKTEIKHITNTKIIETDSKLTEAINQKNWLKRIELGELKKCGWMDIESDCKNGYREFEWHEKK